MLTFCFTHAGGQGGGGGWGVSKNDVKLTGGGQQKSSMPYFKLHQHPLPINNDQSLSYSCINFGMKKNVVKESLAAVSQHWCFS